MLRIKNWDKFQHYKTREKNPGWIKLHRTILDDYIFHQLPVESRALLPMLWLLGSENNGNIPKDYGEIGFRIRMTEKQVDAAIKPLFENGFLESIDCLDNVYTESSLERERELEIEGEQEEEGECKNDDLVNATEIWNEIAVKHKLPRCQNLTEARKKSLKKRLKEAGGIEGWKHACEMLAASPFLKGDNDRGWKASFDFMLQQSSFTKIMEGAYSAYATPRKKNHDPSLETARTLGIIP